MNKKIIGILIVMLLIATAISPISGKIEISTSKTQSCSVEWVKTYGSPEFDMFHCVHQTQDEGFIVSGVSEISDRYYPILMKLDSVGDEEWNWTIQQILYEDIVYDILDVYPIFSNQVNDRGYLFCLWLDINYMEAKLTIAGLFKFNENGEQEWVEFYSEGFEWAFRPISFIEVQDGYVVAGTSGHSSSFLGDEAGLLKTDKLGFEQWYKEYDFGDADNYNNRMEAVCKTSDGGYVMGGFSSSFGAGRFDFWIVKTDSTGNLEWNKTYGGKNDDVCWGLESTDDGGYVAVVTMNNNGFSGDRDDINLVKIDGNGNIVWVQEYGGPDIQIGGYVDKTTDGGFIVAGCTGSFHSSKSDGLLVKFAHFENQRPNKPSKPSGPAKGEPDTEYTFTTSTTDSDGDQVSYMWDWGDGNYSDWLDTNEATNTWTYEDNFNIRVMAKDINGGESEWSDPISFSTPKNKAINPLLLFLEKLIERFPILEQILQPIYDKVAGF